VGAITDVVKRYVPSSYRAMIEASTGYYGITQLQDLADYVQYRLFSTVVGATNEASVWNLKQRHFLGLITTLNFIPAAVDFWGDQLDSEAIVGPSESATYRDPRPDLWKIFAAAKEEAAILAQEVGIGFGASKTVIPSVSYYDNDSGLLTTSNPYDFPSEFESPSLWDQALIWKLGD